MACERQAQAHRLFRGHGKTRNAAAVDDGAIDRFGGSQRGRVQEDAAPNTAEGRIVDNNSQPALFQARSRIRVHVHAQPPCGS